MNCLCASTRYASRQLTRIYEEKLKPSKLTPAQFELLSTIHAMPNSSQTELAEKLGLDQTTLSRNLKLSISHAWIRSTKPSIDSRQSHYVLTPKGKTTWEKAVPFWQEAQQDMEKRLGENWHSVLRALEDLNNEL